MMKKSLAQVVEFCKGRTSVCPLNSVTQCDFFKWSHDNFPDVTMLEFKRDGCDTIVEGIDENNKKIFSFRHARKAPVLSNEYLNILRNDNGTQRIHKTELRYEFAEWVQKNYLNTKYVHIHPQENMITDDCGVPIFRM